MSVTNVVVSGLGGQGVLKITDILAEVIFNQNLDVKKSEVHGMSQRGGSVSSEVRFGEKINSPMVPAGEADLLAVLDVTQIEVALPVLKAGGVLITPATVPMDKLAHPKALNTLMLGALAAHFDQPDEKWLEVLKENLPEKVHQLNEEMFHLGKSSK